jgi:L-iditol 2-dehydrogenase
VFHGPGKIEVTEVDRPSIGPDEILIRVGANVIHYNELEVTGTSDSCRSHDGVALRLIESLIESGRVYVGRVVTHRLPLASISEALDVTAGGEGIKVAVVP